MSQTIPLIKKACDNLGLNYQEIDDAGVFLRINLDNGKFHLCIANNLGLNDGLVEKICNDKTYTHELLSDHVKMPNSISYLDSDPPELYSGFTQYNSHQEIVESILSNQTFPMVIKPNSKAMGINVFSCVNKEEVVYAVNTIFDKKSFRYDYVLLVQEKINIGKEFRVLVYNKEIQLTYQKDNTGNDAKFTGNLSPLHFENSQAVLLDEDKDKKILTKIQEFIKPVFEQMSLNFAGLDIVVDEYGELYLLEINSKPGITYFVRDNGEERLIQMFEKILAELERLV